MEILQKMQIIAKKCLEKSWKDQAARINRQRNPRSYKENDYVYLKIMQIPPNVCKKFFSPWSGPWKIIKKLSEVNYEICDILGKRKQTVHINRLKPAIGSRTPDLVEKNENQDLTSEKRDDNPSTSRKNIPEPEMEEVWSTDDEDYTTELRTKTTVTDKITRTEPKTGSGKGHGYFLRPKTAKSYRFTIGKPRKIR